MQFIDLEIQYQSIQPRIDQAILKVLNHGQYIQGPEVFELEVKLATYSGTKYCVSCSSGTDALLMSLMAKKIGLGDAVFTTPFTFIATAEVIQLLGATPVFVDIIEDTFNIDPSKLKTAIDDCQSKGELIPKAIIPVDIFGLPAEYEMIEKIGNKFDLCIIEDAAQSFGGKIKNKKACSFGDIGTTSFFPAKPLGCYGDGGACFTSDKQLADLIRLLINHGQDKKYNHKQLGINGRMDTLQAAVILAKLHNFEAEIVRRNEVANNYSNMLFKAEEKGFLRLPKIMEHNESVWAQYTIRVDNRHKIQEILNNSGIPTAIHYPVPIHLQPAASWLGYGVGSFPRTECQAKRILSLPINQYLSQDQIGFIAETINRFFASEVGA